MQWDTDLKWLPPADRMKVEERRKVRDADTIADVWTKLSEAVRALPGVSGDPCTVPDIIALVDIFVSTLERLSMDS